MATAPDPQNISTDDSDNGNKKTNRKAMKEIDNDEEQDPKIQTPEKKTDKKELTLKPKKSQMRSSASNTGILKLPNQGNSCYMNAAIQLLQHAHKDDVAKPTCAQDHVACRMLQLSDSNQVGQLYDFMLANMPEVTKGSQHDAHEYLTQAINGCPQIRKDYNYEMQVITKCVTCSHKTETVEQMVDLQLSVEQDNKSTDSLSAAVERYFSEERVNDSHCSSCGEARVCSRTAQMNSTPDKLLLMLKGWTRSEEETQKTHRDVKCDKILKIGDATYVRSAAINHIGDQPTHGHYTSVLWSSGKTVLANDDKISTLESGSADMSKECYVVVYVKKEITAEDVATEGALDFETEEACNLEADLRSTGKDMQHMLERIPERVERIEERLMNYCDRSMEAKQDGWHFGGLNIHHWMGDKKDTENKDGKKAKVEDLIKNYKLDTLVIGESDLFNVSHGQIMINDFSYVKFDRSVRKGGGLIIYLRSSITFSVSSFWEWTDKEFNLQYVELAVTSPFRFDLVAIYSPPDRAAQFLVQRLLFAFLRRNHKRKVKVPVMFIGDLNIDGDRDILAAGIPKVSRAKKERGKKKVSFLFKWFEENYNAEALIKAKTSKKRGDKNKSYCIDHIVTNIHRVPEGREVGVLGNEGYVEHIDPDISDHNLIWCKLESKPSVFGAQRLKYYSLSWSEDIREMTERDKEGNQVGGPKDFSNKAELIVAYVNKLNAPRHGPHPCLAKCNEEFNNCNEIEKHEREKHFSCRYCLTVFKSRYYGPEHMERMHNLYMCRDVHCKETFETWHERDDHEYNGKHIVCYSCTGLKRRAYCSPGGRTNHKCNGTS